MFSFHFPGRTEFSRSLGKVLLAAGLPALSSGLLTSPLQPPALLFPQLAAGGGIRLEIILRNSSPHPDNGTIVLRSDNGRPLTLTLNGRTGDSFPYQLAPGGSFKWEGDDSGMVQAGYAFVVSDIGNRNLRGSVVFSLNGGQVSVSSRPLSSGYSGFVERKTSGPVIASNTGVAFANPSDKSLQISVRLLDQDGKEKARRNLLVEGAGHLAVFVNEAALFQDFFAANPGDFTGSLAATTSDGTFALLMLRQSAGGTLANLGSSPGAPGEDPAGALDPDGDGLSTAEEARQGTDPNLADSDRDGIWDGEEIQQFGTDPLRADSDGDGMVDGADPRPMVGDSGRIPKRSYAIFADNDQGTARVQLTSTKFEQNHLALTPDGRSLLYQTHLADIDGDGEYDDNDPQAAAIGILNADGTRPRILSDLDAEGHVKDNGAVDAVPVPSPDGRWILFSSDRHSPGSFQLRLYTMRMDGSQVTQLRFTDGAPAADELDADPSWGPDNTIAFTREGLTNPTFKKLYTATLNPATMQVSQVTRRSAGPPASFLLNAKGDNDPDISPDGQLIASYRHLDDTLDFGGVPLGDFDLWVGLLKDPNQPMDSTLTFLRADPGVIDAFPRWNRKGDKLAFMVLDPADLSINIAVLDLNITVKPALSVSPRQPARIITRGTKFGNVPWENWMPTWGPNDTLRYSAKHE